MQRPYKKDDTHNPATVAAGESPLADATTSDATFGVLLRSTSARNAAPLPVINVIGSTKNQPASCRAMPGSWASKVPALS